MLYSVEFLKKLFSMKFNEYCRKCPKEQNDTLFIKSE